MHEKKKDDQLGLDQAPDPLLRAGADEPRVR